MRFHEIISEAEQPKKFWLVFDIPVRTPYSGDDASRFLSIYEQLGSGVMHGVKGVSGNREFFGEWFYHARNAALVMDGEQLAANNVLEEIRYDDPVYMFANNCQALFRVWDKNPDQKYGPQGMMQNLIQYFIGSVAAADRQLAHTMSYYGMESRVAYIYERAFADGLKINTIEQMSDFLKRAFPEAALEHFKGLSAELTFDDLFVRRHLLGMLAQLKRLYGSEKEWMVRSETLKIPEGSTLLLSKVAEAWNRYDEWIADPKRDELGRYPQHLTWALESLQQLFQIIHEYELDKRYRIRWIDGFRFASVIPKTMERRRLRAK